MITVQVRCLDFMEGTPIAGADVTVTLKVAPRWVETKYNIRNKDEHRFKIGPGETFDGRGTSSAAGTVRTSFDVNEAFTRQAQQVPIARGTVRPLGAAAFVTSIRVVVAGLIDQTIDGTELFDFKGPELFDPSVEKAPGVMGPDDNVTYVAGIDFAKSLVGHTTPDSALLWFAWHGTLRRGDRYVCEVESLASPDHPVPVRSLPVDFGSAGRAQTAVKPVDGLLPATRYRYVLRPPGGGRALTSGEFTTAPASSGSLSFVFGSCHFPFVFRNKAATRTSLERWGELASRRDYDLMLLMGDQIYGDNIEHLGEDWPERYANRYHQLWAHRPMREVLRRTATYMILDDHEVKDDWGSGPNQSLEAGREHAALTAYRAFQHSHNPPERGPPESFYYSFRRGPAAFFVLDCRSQRNPKATRYPVLGAEQHRQFRDWASGEARQADVIFVVSGVPMAFLPVEQFKRIMKSEKASRWDGFIEGVKAGDKTKAGIFGAIAYGIIGPFVVKKMFEEEWKGALSESDLQDMWTYEPNQDELVQVLNVLFDLANDVTGNPPGDHPRAVFILGGDVHMGGRQVIESRLPNHQKNRFIHQLISSPISNEPPSKVEVDKILKDFKLPTYALDDRYKQFWVREWELLVERNFGRIAVARASDKEGRVYRFSLSIEGRSGALSRFMELDLAPERVVVRDTLSLPAGLAEGELIKGPDDPAVFLIENGTRRWIPDELTFRRRWTWDQMKNLPAETVDAIPRGRDLPTGAPLVAFQANDGDLWTIGADNHRANHELGMMAGTSPSIAVLSGGGYVVAFQANTGDLWTIGADNRGNHKLGMMAGTSPSIAALPGGGYVVAFQANTGNLWTIGADNSGDWACGMMAGTSPSIAVLSGGGYVVAFQANDGNLWTVGGDNHGGWGLGMMAGTSPSIAALPGGGYVVAFQANTGNLWTIGADNSGDWACGMMAGTSPSIAALSGGGYVVAFQANDGNLWTVGGDNHGGHQLGMMAGTSPSIAAQPGGGYVVAFQANTGNLWTIGADNSGDWALGMMAGTSPSIG